MNWLERRRERRRHDDRDYACRYWWGDRGGYDLSSVRCAVCNPERERMIIGAEERASLRMLESARHPMLETMVHAAIRRLYDEADRKGIDFKDDDVHLALRLEVQGVRREG